MPHPLDSLKIIFCILASCNSALDSGSRSPGSMQALPGDTVLCSGVTQITLTLCFYTQVYRWVVANLMLGVCNPTMDKYPIWGGEVIFLVASCYGNRDKLMPVGPLGSYADFTLTSM